MSLQTMPATRRHPYALTADDMARLMARGTVGLRPAPEPHPGGMPPKNAFRMEWDWMETWEIGQTVVLPYRVDRSKVELRGMVYTAARFRDIRCKTHAATDGIHATRIS